jgi:hypothetical protein
MLEKITPHESFAGDSSGAERLIGYTGAALSAASYRRHI